MRLEYFQMIDRIVALDVGSAPVRSACTVPKREHDLRRPFSELSADARRAADRMHGADLRMAGDGALDGFSAMPFLAGVKEAKFRTAVVPGDELEFEGDDRARGLGLRRRRMQRPARRAKSVCEAQITLSHHALSQPGIPPSRFANGRERDRRSGVKELSQVTERREVWITGVGLLTCLGEGLDANWAHLERGDPPPYDDKTFAPYIVHPLAPVNFDKQIPKKSDQRQMEMWQRIGVYAAGLALGDAGIAGKPELLDDTDHDRRRRRRRARHRRRQRDPHRHAQSDRARGASSTNG